MFKAHEPPIRPQPYARLLVSYALLFTYSVTAFIAGIPTQGAVNGETWELIFPTLLGLSSLAAFLGVFRSKRKRRYGVELAATLGLVSLLVSYGVTIAILAVVTNHPSFWPGVFLPIIIVVPPYARLTDLVRTPTVDEK